ncbi:MAG TPA: hypothetical protein VME66_09915 [Candidatus Acidoferrales bacterium]|nr:hypothetical protein [Candidatus Acidoferrales bacterium]
MMPSVPMIVRVPPAARAPYALATHYLARDREMRSIIQTAQTSSRVFSLRLNGHDDDSFDPNSDTINWDPGSALRTTAGGAQSPALGLGHELDHAVEEPRTMARLAAQPDERYDNAEERRVITGAERHAARTLGEATRSDHAGTTFRVDSPIFA